LTFKVWTESRRIGGASQSAGVSDAPM